MTRKKNRSLPIRCFSTERVYSSAAIPETDPELALRRVVERPEIGGREARLHVDRQVRIERVEECEANPRPHLAHRTEFVRQLVELHVPLDGHVQGYGRRKGAPF